MKNTTLSVFFLILSSLCSAQYLDSLKNFWQDESQDNEERLAALYDYAWDGYIFSQPDSARYYFNKVRELNQENDYLLWESNADHGIAISYWVQGNHDSAIYYSEKALEIRMNTDNEESKANSYNTLGMLYHEKGEYRKAVKFYNKCLGIRETINDSVGKAGVLNNIGLIYQYIKDYDKAYDYFKRSYELSVKTNHQENIASSLNNLGLIFQYKGDELSNNGLNDEAKEFYSKALKKYNECLEIRKNFNNSIAVAQSEGNIGIIYFKQGKYKEALDIQLKSLKKFRDVGDQKNTSFSLSSIANLYYHLGNDYSNNKSKSNKLYQTGLQYALEAKEIANQSKMLLEQEQANKVLHQLFKVLNQPKKALKAYESYIQAKEEIENEENKKDLIRQEIEYHYGRKSLADSIEYEKEKKLKEAEIQRQNIVLESKKKQMYFMIGGISITAIFALLIFNRFKITQKQKKTIETKKLEVELKNQEILDSINYAKRIQNAILPSMESMKYELKDGFVLYLPKDVVAGDFYWLEKYNDKIYFAAADCTGHGIPGAMMSVICSNALSKSLQEENISEPHLILERTRELIINRLAKSGSDIQDGMDISLIALNKPSEDLEPSEGLFISYAGANNPLWLVRKEKINPLNLSVDEEKYSILYDEKSGSSLIEFKPDKQPIGYYKTEMPFNKIDIPFKKGDIIYSLTDGFSDQFGGENIKQMKSKGKKYKTKNLKRFILSMQNLSMDDQKIALQNEFNSWKGDLEQVDDVCIIGVRL